MKTFIFKMSCGFVGTDREEEFEFHDDVTDDEVQEEWKDWVWELIDGTYYEKE